MVSTLDYRGKDEAIASANLLVFQFNRLPFGSRKNHKTALLDSINVLLEEYFRLRKEEEDEAEYSGARPS